MVGVEGMVGVVWVVGGKIEVDRGIQTEVKETCVFVRVRVGVGEAGPAGVQQAL